MDTVITTPARVFQSQMLDSTRWRHYQPRASDVLVVSSYKAGTTWMIAILGHLLSGDLKRRPNSDFSRWLDIRFPPVELEIAAIEAMTGRRVLKSHLAADTLPFRSGLPHILLGRDLRDVFMSLWNHHTNYTPQVLAAMHSAGDSLGIGPVPVYDDIHAFWHDWSSKGICAGESQGYPYWSALDHMRSWWDLRTQADMLFVHYNDLLSDPSGQIARTAAFLGIPLSEKLRDDIAGMVSFDSMKRDADILDPGAHATFTGGLRTFLHKGSNGRWRGVLSHTELQAYEAMMALLPADCVAWLEGGAHTFGEEPAGKDAARRAIGS